MRVPNLYKTCYKTRRISECFFSSWHHPFLQFCDIRQVPDIKLNSHTTRSQCQSLLVEDAIPQKDLVSDTSCKYWVPRFLAFISSLQIWGFPQPPLSDLIISMVLRTQEGTLLTGLNLLVYLKGHKWTARWRDMQGGLCILSASVPLQLGYTILQAHGSACQLGSSLNPIVEEFYGNLIMQAWLTKSLAIGD